MYNTILKTENIGFQQIFSQIWPNFNKYDVVWKNVKFTLENISSNQLLSASEHEKQNIQDKIIPFNEKIKNFTKNWQN